MIAQLHHALSVRIPGRPPTANARRHWRSIARDNVVWKEAAIIVAEHARALWENRHGLRWHPLRMAKVEVIFGLHTHAHRDWDNLVCSIKPELDGIVAAGLLVDDSTDVIASISFATQYSKGEPYTEFVIEEVHE